MMLSVIGAWDGVVHGSGCRDWRRVHWAGRRDRSSVHRCCGVHGGCGNWSCVHRGSRDWSAMVGRCRLSSSRLGTSSVGFEVHVMDAGDPSLLLAGLCEEGVELFGVVAEDDWLHEGFLLVEEVFLRECSGEGEHTKECDDGISMHLFFKVKL